MLLSSPSRNGDKCLRYHKIHLCWICNYVISTSLAVMVEKNRLSPWKGVVSGTTAAILANALVYPLDM